MPKKELILKNEEKIQLNGLSRKDSPKELMVYINSLIEEKTFPNQNRKYTLREQKEWLRQKLIDTKRREYLYIIASKDGKMIASADARRLALKMRGNVEIGIAILPEHRNKGLGRLLMNEIVSRAKTVMKPKNIFLTVDVKNEHAKKLYDEGGFRKIAVLPNWANHYGKYHDQEIRVLAR